MLDVAKNKDWKTTEEIAEILGVSKQAVHKMIANGTFRTACWIGRKPIYMVSTRDVEKIREQRLNPPPEKTRAEARAELHELLEESA